MARARGRKILVLALAAVGLLVCRPGGLAQVEGGQDDKGPAARLQEEVARVGRFWEQPHNVRLSHGGIGFRSISQGRKQWEVSISEDGDLEKAGVFACEHSDRGVVYGLDYDSAKSRYSIADAAGVKLKRVAFSAASKKATDSLDADWTLHVEGDQGRHFSATGDKESIVYDGSFGIEVPVVKDVSLRYALDAKRRAGSRILPSWLRHSLGLRYASPAGDVKLRVHQPDPDYDDAPVEYEASLEGNITGPKVKGSPKYILRARRDAADSASYEATMKLKGPEGLSGGLTAAVRGGKSAISAVGNYDVKRVVAKGIELGADAKVALSPPPLSQGNEEEEETEEDGNEVLSLHPIGLSAAIDLSELAPSIADAGSNVSIRARYKIGAQRPALSASARLNAKRLEALQVAGEASVDDQGQSSGKFRLVGTARGVAARYEAVAPPSGRVRHAAQVVWPVELGRGNARAFGRLFQSDADNGGKPRLQLGVQYDFNTEVAGRTVRVDGESAAYDSGSALLAESGLPWHDQRLNRIRQSAAVLRRRIEGAGLESHGWLQG